MKVKALALFSGGLDSSLSAKIILEQGVEVEAIYFVNAFLSARYKDRQAGLPGYKRDAQKDFPFLQKRQAQRLGMKLHILDISRPHLELVQRPRFGYGKNMNPCIDCRILMLKKAKGYMQSYGFSFLISGEVLGQRPMSQRRDALNIVDRDAHVKGLLLRPLSAKKLVPTLAEDAGWVERDKLFDFSGRSRKPQIALARKLGIKEYLTPAGGCLLTESEFARRFKDLTTSGKFDLDDVLLLKIGRHFRFECLTKIIVGRNEQENEHLTELADDADILVKMRDFVGPITVIRRPNAFCSGIGKYIGYHCENRLKVIAERFSCAGLIESAARLTARYGKGKDKKKVWVDYWPKGSEKKQSISVNPAGEDLIEQLRI